MVDTSGREFSCGNERIIGAAVRLVRAVGSLYVTVLGSAAYIGAMVPCQGVAWVQKRSDAFQKIFVKTDILWWWILKVGRAQRRYGGDTCSVLSGQPSGSDVRRLLVCAKLGLQ